jgi:hypothetical protein
MMPHIYLAHQMAGNLGSRRPDWLRSDRRLKLVHAFPDYACLVASVYRGICSGDFMFWTTGKLEVVNGPKVGLGEIDRRASFFSNSVPGTFHDREFTDVWPFHTQFQRRMQ